MCVTRQRGPSLSAERVNELPECEEIIGAPPLLLCATKHHTHGRV